MFYCNMWLRYYQVACPHCPGCQSVPYKFCKCRVVAGSCYFVNGENSTLSVFEWLGLLHQHNYHTERNPPFVAYRCLPNLRTLLAQATFKRKQYLSYKGNFRCQQTCRKICNHIKPIKWFKSLVIGKTCSIKASANCKQPMWSM